MIFMKIVSTARSGGTARIVSAHEAVRLVRDGDTIATGNLAGIGFAELNFSGPG